MNIKSALAEIEKAEFSTYGLRVMTDVENVSVGDEVSNSFIWIDGVSADDSELEGASALDLQFDGWEVEEARFMKMLERSNMYGRDYPIVVVGTNSSDTYEGNDLHEVVMPNAVCVVIVS